MSIKKLFSRIKQIIMPYSSFTIAQVKRQFQIEVITEPFFSDVPKLAPGEWLATFLSNSAPLAVTLGTEKVRSELIIAPLLFEFRELLDRQVSFFSGTDFSLDVESGLNGVCDFLLTRSKSEVNIEAPAIIIIEAKKGELNVGWGQCAAEMIAAQRFNLAAGEEVPNIYGCVTTGTMWQFLKLTGTVLTIDVTEYPLNPIDRILGILKWMVEIPERC
jgi:hypothetical protein